MGEAAGVRRAWAGLLSMGMASWAAPARALTLSLSCSRLSRRQRSELSARVRLTLAGLREAPRALSVECDAQHAWIVWRGARSERLDVDERSGLVEGVLAALEARARSGPSRPAKKPSGAKPAAPPGARPVAPAPSRRAAQPARATSMAPTQSRPPSAPLEGGGVGLGASGELWGAAGVAVGGRLDVGLGFGPLVGVASEQLCARTESVTTELTFSTLAGVAWGAPWQGRAHFGFDVLAGLEWFHTGSTDSSAIFDVGARAGWPTGDVVWWVGADARLRAHRESSGEPLSLVLPRVSAALSLGVVLLAHPAD